MCSLTNACVDSDRDDPTKKISHVFNGAADFVAFDEVFEGRFFQNFEDFDEI